MRIIDPHVHVWTRDPAFPVAPGASLPEEDRTPEMLLELMQAHGVEKTVLVQQMRYGWDNRYTAHALRQYPDKFMGVCRVNPEDPASPDELTRLVQEDGFHGVRLIPAADATGDWFNGPLVEPLFARAEQLGVPMLIYTRPARLVRLAEIMDRHPDLDVCIDHMAECSPEDEEGVRKLLALARYPRTYVKISHTWSISKQDYPWRDTWPLVRRVYQTFGPRRIMWDTDWPVSLRRTTYGRTLSVVRDEMDFFSAEDLEWVLGKTALQLWPFAA